MKHSDPDDPAFPTPARAAEDLIYLGAAAEVAVKDSMLEAVYSHRARRVS